MICRDCPHATIGTTDGDKQMAKQGYKTCKLARDAIERATYVRGNQECLWPGRAK